MAPPTLKKEPSHFDVLSLTPTSLDGQDPPTQTKTVKQAYRRALLKHHPDKNQQAKAQNAPSDPSASQKDGKKKDEQHFTVDQITEAFTVLSDTRQRREYVRSLQTQSHTSGTFSSSSSSNQKNGNVNANGNASQNYNYHKTFNFKSTPQQQQAQPQSSGGVETVDLDDLAWDGRKQVYHQTCGRCGTERGYCFRELDLDEVGEDGELMVQCNGCSLWLRVLFDEAEDDEDEGDDDGGREVRQRTNSQGEELRNVRSGSASGKSGGWSWKFNFGISIGGGASASASAERK
ncbi:DnaJ domain-containing protein [Seiridium cupressi]